MELSKKNNYVITKVIVSLVCVNVLGLYDVAE